MQFEVSQWIRVCKLTPQRVETGSGAKGVSASLQKLMLHQLATHAPGYQPTKKELADQLYIDLKTVGRILAVLQAQGYVSQDAFLNVTPPSGYRDSVPADRDPVPGNSAVAIGTQSLSSRDPVPVDRDPVPVEQGPSPTIVLKSTKEKKLEEAIDSSPDDFELSSSRRKKERPTKDVPPELQAVRDYRYSLGPGNGGDDSTPDEFFDHYESVGWIVGRRKMKDWMAAYRNWVRRNKRFNQTPAANRGSNRSESNAERERQKAKEVMAKQGMPEAELANVMANLVRKQRKTHMGVAS